jgi:hypothetical protein
MVHFIDGLDASLNGLMYLEYGAESEALSSIKVDKELLGVYSPDVIHHTEECRAKRVASPAANVSTSKIVEEPWKVV